MYPKIQLHWLIARPSPKFYIFLLSLVDQRQGFNSCCPHELFNRAISSVLAWPLGLAAEPLDNPLGAPAHWNSLANSCQVQRAHLPSFGLRAGRCLCHLVHMALSQRLCRDRLSESYHVAPGGWVRSHRAGGKMRMMELSHLRIPASSL